MILNENKRLGELGNLGEPVFALLKSWITGFQPLSTLLSYKKNILLILIYLLIIRVLLFYLFIRLRSLLFWLSIGVILSWIWIRRKKAELMQQDQGIYATSEDVTC
jgi:TctA family transporter